MLCRPARSSDWLVSVNRNSEFDRMDSSRMECEIVFVVEQRLFFGNCAPAGETQLPFFILKKDHRRVSAPRQLERDVEHGHQNLVQHARPYLTCGRPLEKSVSFSRSVASCLI